jgi:glucokinase
MAANPGVVLAADVGGTNTKLALGRPAAGRCTIVEQRGYSSGAYASFELAVEAFLREPDVAPHAAQVRAACFAVAGPVEDGCAQLTNLSWRIDEAALARHFGIPHVKVINDFAAAGLGIDELAQADLLTLQAGGPVAGAHRVIVGAGTGLGIALLMSEGGCYRVHSSEGGHSDFAPIDALQDELLRELRGEFGHVSAERVVSGPGLPRIVDFLAGRGATPGADLLNAMAQGNAAGAITEFALAKRDPVAEQALDVFVSAYGAFAGNAALMALAHGGVYVAGGIAPKIAAKLPDGTFMRAFTAKGRFRGLLETIPVKVVLNEHIGLLGAAAEAARLARS